MKRRRPAIPAKVELPEVQGLDLDANTRCLHYRGADDIIAIRMKCCGAYYACIDCHTALAGHAAEVWPRSEWPQPGAVLCGHCGLEMAVSEYLDCNHRCPGCGSAFNPGCRNHYPLYFES